MAVQEWTESAKEEEKAEEEEETPEVLKKKVKRKSWGYVTKIVR